MPYINLQVTKGVSRPDKRELVRLFTTALVEVLGKDPQHTHMVIQEIDEDNWGFAGMLTDEYRQQDTSDNLGPDPTRNDGRTAAGSNGQIGLTNFAGDR